MATYEQASIFSDEELTILRFADAMTDTPAHVSDALLEALQTSFDAAQIVELSAAIAWENYRARFNRSFDLGSEGFSEGVFCPMPVHSQ